MLNKRYDASKDYFALLGVHQQACEKTIKQAYRKMARRYHPDVSKIHNATEKFQEISEAYEVLTKFRDAYWRDYSRTHRIHGKANGSEKNHRNIKNPIHVIGVNKPRCAVKTASLPIR